MRALVEWPKTLEGENANLLLEIEELKKHASSKATALKYEIGMLREEVESLRTLLEVGDEFSGEPLGPKAEKAEKAKSNLKILR